MSTTERLQKALHSLVLFIPNAEARDPINKTQAYVAFAVDGFVLRLIADARMSVLDPCGNSLICDPPLIRGEPAKRLKTVEKCACDLKPIASAILANGSWSRAASAARVDPFAKYALVRSAARRSPKLRGEVHSAQPRDLS